MCDLCLPVTWVRITFGKRVILQSFWSTKEYLSSYLKWEFHLQTRLGEPSDVRKRQLWILNPWYLWDTSISALALAQVTWFTPLLLILGWRQSRCSEQRTSPDQTETRGDWGRETEAGRGNCSGEAILPSFPFSWMHTKSWSEKQEWTEVTEGTFVFKMQWQKFKVPGWMCAVCFFECFPERPLFCILSSPQYRKNFHWWRAITTKEAQSDVF